MWFGVAEIQEIFEDATRTDISDEDGGQRVAFGRFSGIIGLGPLEEKSLIC